MRPIPFHRSIRPRPARRGRSGFTLLELVAVIGIIALMSVLVVAGFSGIMRAVSATSGTDALRRAINLARQQACIDGMDTYVWVTGIDKFAVVRKVGTIASRNPGSSMTPPYLGVSRSDARWIVDEFADIDMSGLKIAGTDAPDVFVQRYTGIKAFDMTDNVMADIKYPPWLSPLDDAWVFGISKDASGFSGGSVYGWLVFPEQSLPSGYVFENSFDKTTGKFNPTPAQQVHFRSDGTVVSGFTFKLVEVASGKTHKVDVSGEGKITVEIEGEEQDQGG